MRDAAQTAEKRVATEGPTALTFGSWPPNWGTEGVFPPKGEGTFMMGEGEGDSSIW
jgi:hypothetical protein